MRKKKLLLIDKLIKKKNTEREREREREIPDSPSLAFRYTVLATMFSNSINSSLIRFARPNRVREEEASWSMTTMAGELELDRTEHVRSQSRFSLRGIDHPVGSCSSHLQPRDTTRVHDLSPFVRDQRERENPSAFHVNLDSDLEAVWSRDFARPRITARSTKRSNGEASDYPDCDVFVVFIAIIRTATRELTGLIRLVRSRLGEFQENRASLWRPAVSSTIPRT
jgi:hypothetical protein